MNSHQIKQEYIKDKSPLLFYRKKSKKNKVIFSVRRLQYFISLVMRHRLSYESTHNTLVT